MARDIKTTPIIFGQDAVRFYRELEKNQNRIVDRTVLERIEESSHYIQSLGIRRI